MTYEDVIEFYGSAEKAGEAIGRTRQAVHRWKTVGIPREFQIDWEIATNGKLRADLPRIIRRAAHA